MDRPIGLDCFIYLRKSRKDIEEERKALNEGGSYDTLERHRRQLLELAKKEHHNILEIFEEVVSGEHIIDRPEIQRMLRKVEANAVDAVLVMDLDRLGRGDMFDMGYIFRTLQYSETIIVTPTEIINPLAEGAELLFGVKSIISREELKAITKRMQRGRRVSAQEGKSVTRKPPFGYIRDENLKLHPDPETSWVVKKIFEMIADGHGRSSVIHELRKLGIKSPDKAREWNAVQIRNMLNNEVYLGHIVWGKMKWVKRSGKYISKALPSDQWIRRDNAHEPIISQELWERAHASYGKKTPKTRKKSKLVNPLAGLLYCRYCGYAIVYSSDKKGCDMYKCKSSHCKGKQRSALVSLVEQRVLKSLEQIVSEFEANEEHQIKQPSTIPMKKKALTTKNSELVVLNKQKDNLHDLLEQGIYDVTTFKERQKIVVDKIKTVQLEIDELKQEIEYEQEKEKKQVKFIPKIKTVIEAYHFTDDVRKKNQLLKSVLKKILYERKPKTKRDGFALEIFPHI
ncbi:recombinase family protein [Thermoflavimicrobium daqui]|uniref:Recombinase n=1 Tax=Thermoflavimicrobium daqui TaxID=2137476 RepID=A0A364K2B2_9BACL|nr:recombinase family protein [Thermoflavimicrobium daqui]RAL22558.1 recombinase [Thermoflavimicrobium daqui]